MTRSLGFYDGSTVLQPLASLTGLGIDEFNFVFCQVLSLLLCFPYRTVWGPGRCTPTQRHAIQIGIGLVMTYFCFGRQIIHLLAQSITCYIVMKTVRPGIMEKLVFTIALGYLCWGHIYRQYYDYKGYVMDVTTLLMLNTQRVSSLAYSYRDGLKLKKEDGKLSPFLKKYATERLPSLLEYFSYIFCFHTLLAGPYAFYTDYESYINGTNITRHKQNIANGSTSDAPENPPCLPNPMPKVLEKLFCAAVTGMLMTTVIPLCPVEYLVSPEFFSEYSFVGKVLYMVTATMVHRNRYYFAWFLVEAINTNAGLAFNGYDESGKPKWDLLDNVHIWKLETGTSFKSIFDNWNINTALWLRYVVYERVHSTVLVFLFSAFWHGFYPGTYVTFTSAAFCLITSRQVRRNVRHFFQHSRQMALLYDALTFIATRVTLAYCVYPHILMDFWAPVQLYREMYYFLHFATIGVAIFFYFVKLAPPRESREKPSTSANNSNNNQVPAPAVFTADQASVASTAKTDPVQAVFTADSSSVRNRFEPPSAGTESQVLREGADGKSRGGAVLT